MTHPDDPDDLDPVIVESSRSCTYAKDGMTVEVAIYRLESSTEWALEVIDSHGTSLVWNDEFASEDEAWAAFETAVKEEGLHGMFAPDDPRKMN